MRVKISFENGATMITDTTDYCAASDIAKRAFPGENYQVSMENDMDSDEILGDEYLAYKGLVERMRDASLPFEEYYLALRFPELNVGEILSLLRSVGQEQAVDDDKKEVKKPDVNENMKERAAEISQNENDEFFENFMQSLHVQMFEDDESPCKAGRSLFYAYATGDVDGILLALTGWTLESLLRMM